MLAAASPAITSALASPIAEAKEAGRASSSRSITCRFDCLLLHSPFFVFRFVFSLNRVLTRSFWLVISLCSSFVFGLWVFRVNHVMFYVRSVSRALSNHSGSFPRNQMLTNTTIFTQEQRESRLMNMPLPQKTKGEHFIQPLQ